MQTTIVSYWNFIKNIGIAPNTRPYELKIRQFYNLVSFLGAFTGVTHVILAAPYDLIATILHAIWTCLCFVGLFVHRYFNFKAARFITFTSVFVFAGLASARLGFELNTHFASFGIVVACFIMHDLKKEWGWLIFYMSLETITIILTESNYIKSEELAAVASGSPVFTRTFTLLGTMGFVMFQFIFFIGLSVKNERKIIDQLRISNKELMELNNEKEVLLKEVHHRVKNNLQIISSLLSLQSNEIKDNASKEKFIDAVNRVQSISALHKVIYNSDNLLKINLETYLHEIAENIIQSYGLKKKINYTISSELTSIQNDSIVPISLILNELMSNSLKHGFANQQVCEITVAIVALGENKYQLSYSDNGTWKTAEPANTSFGIELIESLTEQLDGKIVQTPNEKESLYVIDFYVETF